MPPRQEPTDEFTVRRYRPPDADRVRAIHEAALRASPIDFVEDAPADDDLGAVAESYLDGDGDFLVGLAGDGIVATGGYRRVDDRTAALRRLRVHPDHQRSGFGARLLAHLERRMAGEGFDAVVLETHADLAAARRLYEAAGYERTGSEPHPETGDEVVSYRRDLARTDGAGAFLVGSDDGVYRVDEGGESSAERATRTLDAGRVYRLRRFDGLDGVFAATETGLYRSTDGDAWTDLAVPREQVYAVGAGPARDRLYAGTRPAAVFATETASLATGDANADADADANAGVEWRELRGFQALPSRDQWRLPRHEQLAQVRDVHADPRQSNRVVAGVEVGGVHVSDDGGETWTDRAQGVDDDVHELHVVGSAEYVAATGHGLYATDDAGRTWDRLDGAVAQTYFRSAFSVDGVVYASGALANSSTWDDPDADPALFAVRDGSLEPVALPVDETVTGMTAVDGDLVVATHRGGVFVRRADGWTEAAAFPVTDRPTGRYTPIVRADRPRDGGVDPDAR